MQGHICCASVRAQARTAVALDARSGEQKGTLMTSEKGGGGVGGRSGPHAYKVRSGRGGSSQPSGQVKGAHQLQVRGARTQTSCHASVRPPAVPAGARRALLRLLHPELPPGRETSAAGERHQTGGETRSAFFYSDIMPTSH